MSKETIPLAKGYDPSKMEFPALFSEKLDGVPIRIDVFMDCHGAPVDHKVRSRSGKPVPSVGPLVANFVAHLGAMGIFEVGSYTFVGEVTHRTLTAFKDVSGVVRKQTPQPDLVINIFDFVDHIGEPLPFDMRYEGIADLFDGRRDIPYFTVISQTPCSNEKDVEVCMTALPAGAEGGILRSASQTWEPGTRHWDYQKVVVDPVSDLMVVGYEQATSADGDPLGMVGRINCQYKGAIIGCGPGRMTHTDRRSTWEEYSTRCGMIDGPAIAAIKHKRDDSYTMLRQPTFQCWRPDKTEPSYG